MEKTDPAEIPVPAPLPEFCCAKCAHGVEITIPPNLQKMIRCQGLPPSPVLIPGPQGPVIQSQFPVVPLNICCGMFTPRPEKG